MCGPKLEKDKCVYIETWYVDATDREHHHGRGLVGWRLALRVPGWSAGGAVVALQVQPLAPWPDSDYCIIS